MINPSFPFYVCNVKQKVPVCDCLSQTVIGSDLKFAHVILDAIRRSTVLFSIFPTFTFS